MIVDQGIKSQMTHAPTNLGFLGFLPWWSSFKQEIHMIRNV